MVTPKRPDATCLMAERLESPLGKRVESFGGLPHLLRCLTYPQAVHGDGQGFVGLSRNRTVGHGPGGEALDNLTGGLNLLQGDTLPGDLNLRSPRIVAWVLLR
jgi:hypothetical protein